MLPEKYALFFRRILFSTFLLLLIFIPARVQAASRTCTLRFCQSATGQTIKKVKVPYGDSYTFESPGKDFFDYTHFTFMGWDTTPGKTKNASFHAGQTISNIRKNAVYYDVAFRKSTESTVSLPKLSPEFKEVILVGDSRTIAIGKALSGNYSEQYLANILISARASKGLTYFARGKARGSLNAVTQILEEDNEPDGRPIAIVINYGVNDLAYAAPGSDELESVVHRYITFMNKTAKQLYRKYNVVLFYASIAPVNHVLQSSRYEESVLAFNQQLSRGLKGNYTWINLYNHLMKYGFSFNYRNNTDGIHYREKTYLRCANFLINQVNRGE